MLAEKKLRKRVLYLTYDGISDSLGYSQVFSYLKGLAADYDVSLISFEKVANLGSLPAIKAEARKFGIKWYPLRYHKSPTAIATSFDILQGLGLALLLSIPTRFQIVHARSYVVSVIALLLKKLTGASFIFDMRGFWVEERVESGLWKKDSTLVHLGKFFERQFFCNADVVVSLSEAGAKLIKKFDYLQTQCPPIEVITTCTDLTRFQLSERNQKDARFVVGYVGSVGLWYDFEATARCFKLLCEARPDLKPFFYIINQKEHAFIREKLESAGVTKNEYEIVSRSFEEMPKEFTKMAMGLFFIRPTYAKQASAPTKLGEYLACGVPCLINAKIGDSGNIVHREQVGVVVDDLSDHSLKLGLEAMLALLKNTSLPRHCRKTAEDLFSLHKGIQQYGEIYNRLLKQETKPLLHVKRMSNASV